MTEQKAQGAAQPLHHPESKEAPTTAYHRTARSAANPASEAK